MLSAGIHAPLPLNELEIHLREEIERQMHSGLDEQNAFKISAQQIGQAQALKNEFKKIAAENWNRPLAWVAWTLFVISFFLPAYTETLGWRCAGLSANEIFRPEFGRGTWPSIHLASLTFANLLMVVSPFLLSRFSQNVRVWKWLRLSNLIALTLVWSYLLLWIIEGNGADLKAGCYVWAAAFLFLNWSTLKIRNHKTLQIAPD
jgi:hypothetical protein